MIEGLLKKKKKFFEAQPPIINYRTLSASNSVAAPDFSLCASRKPYVMSLCALGNSWQIYKKTR